MSYLYVPSSTYTDTSTYMHHSSTVCSPSSINPGSPSLLAAHSLTKCIRVFLLESRLIRLMHVVCTPLPARTDWYTGARSLAARAGSSGRIASHESQKDSTFRTNDKAQAVKAEHRVFMHRILNTKYLYTHVCLTSSSSSLSPFSSQSPSQKNTIPYLCLQRPHLPRKVPPRPF